jgi:hypothetical protein
MYSTVVGYEFESSLLARKLAPKSPLSIFANTSLKRTLFPWSDP